MSSEMGSDGVGGRQKAAAWGFALSCLAATALLGFAAAGMTGIGVGAAFVVIVIGFFSPGAEL